MKKQINIFPLCTVMTIPDLKKIKVTFIIDTSSTNIYDKFRRQFSDAVLHFKCTPKIILKLSLLDAHKNTDKMQ